jgi:hypothetical protein
MKKLIITIIMMSLSLLISACAPSQASTDVSAKDPIEAAPVSPEPSKVEEKIAYSEKTNFSIMIKDGWITLGKYETDNQLSALLGKALNEETEVLSNADTFNGSFIKKQKYDGLALTLMSPKDNGKEFWLMEAVISDPAYTTVKGIKVGDTLADLKKEYPDAKIALDGRTDGNNCAYDFSSEDSLDHINFEVKAGSIVEIKFYKELP